MELLVFGGFHYNPLHRERLKQWMEFLRDKKGDPTFIAVEANRILFHAVIRKQRRKFVEIAKADLRLGGLKELDALSKAIDYEADTHEEVFKEEQNVIWLDDGRKDLTTICDPCDTAERFLSLCQKALESSNFCAPDLARYTPVITAIDQYIKSVGQKFPTNPNREALLHEMGQPYCDRDRLWLGVLKPHCVHDAQGYGIVVVGENHTIREGNSLVKHLEGIEQPCNVHLLRNENAPTNKSILSSK